MGDETVQLCPPLLTSVSHFTSPFTDDAHWASQSGLDGGKAQRESTVSTSTCEARDYVGNTAEAVKNDKQTGVAGQQLLAQTALAEQHPQPHKVTFNVRNALMGSVVTSLRMLLRCHEYVGGQYDGTLLRGIATLQPRCPRPV